VPGGAPAGLATDRLQFLTVEQALADLAGFVEFYKERAQAVCPAAARAKVFTFGGSYPGALSAWFRIQYPNHTSGSLASSGVVDAVLDFWQFDNQIAETVGPECAAALRSATAALEAAVGAGGASRDAALALYALDADADLSAADFLYMVADGAAMAVQYGHRSELCAEMAKAADPSVADPSVADLSGRNFAPEHPRRDVAGPGALPAPARAMAAFTLETWGPSFAKDCFYSTACLRDADRGGDPSRWQPTARSWRWQKCSQLAYWQAAPTAAESPVPSVRAATLTIEALSAQCAEAFGAGYARAPDVEAFNAVFGGATPTFVGGWKGAPGNIFFTNGGDDPWQRASVAHDLQPGMPEDTARCVDCGHCGDLHAPTAKDPPELQAQRARFRALLAQWMAETPPGAMHPTRVE
jgi:hypothetical protein